MIESAARFLRSSRRLAGALSLAMLLPVLALCMGAALPATAAPLLAAPAVEAPPAVASPWAVSESRDRAGMVAGCIAERSVDGLKYRLRRAEAGIDLQLMSDRWALQANATYPVQLVAAARAGEQFLGRVAAPNRLDLALGPQASASAFLLGAVSPIEIRAAGGRLSLPVDALGPTLAALETCWTDASRAAANPFAAKVAGIQQDSAIEGAESGLVEEHVYFDVKLDDGLFRLDGIAVKPAGATGKLPVALLTHGTTSDPIDMPALRASTMLPQARDLAERGYLAIAFSRRGYGLSQGPPREGRTTCSRPGFHDSFDADAAELAAVLDLARQRADVDPSRAIAVGVSGGGGAVLALAARRPEGLSAVVNISGGLNLIREDGSHCSATAELQRTFAEFGARSRVPTLWIYAENDSFFPPETVEQLHKGFVERGGPATLSMLPPVGANGHDIFATPTGRYHWLPRLDAFLRDQDLPTWTMDQADLVMRTAGLRRDQRNWVMRYLSAPTEKTLVAAASGRGVRLRFGQGDAAASRRAALADCEREFGESCVVVMRNFALMPSAREPATAALGVEARR